jgi:hypothetical protein
MKARIYIGPVDKTGHLPRNQALAIQATLLELAGKTVKVTVGPFHAKRSESQNSYYWAVIVPSWRTIFLDTGEVLTDDEVHAFLAQNVGKITRTVVSPDGSMQTIVRSSSDLTTKEFTDFIEVCRTLAANFGYDIPPPTKEATNG